MNKHVIYPKSLMDFFRGVDWISESVECDGWPQGWTSEGWGQGEHVDPVRETLVMVERAEWVIMR